MPLVATRGAASAQGFGEFAQSAPPIYIEDVFQTWLYTGNGSTQTITNGVDLAGKGGLTWIKRREAVGNHNLFDTARGATKKLYSDLTNAEFTDAFSLTSFNSNGFSIDIDVNGADRSYVSWTFRKQPKFFDVVTWTGTGSSRTVSHNLGCVPACIIVKRTDAAADWQVYNALLDAGGSAAMSRIVLNSTAGQQSASLGYWDGTAPTSTVFSLGGDTSVNASGGTYVAYLFANQEGGFGLTGAENVITWDSFTTDGSGNATVNLGYEPQWGMIKRIDGPGNWFMLNNMSGWSNVGTNGSAQRLYANTSGAEATDGVGFPTASGFAARALVASAAYIYVAIRRGPMKTPTTGTSVFAPVLAASASETVNTVGFTPDMQLIKQTGNAVGTNAVDRLRGVSTRRQFNAGQFLLTSSTAAESSNFSTQYWDNTGFSTPFDTSGISTIYWTFRRAPSVFDVVCYTGNGTAGRTIAHNLGVAPELLIVKTRNNASEWQVYSAALGAGQALNLHLADAAVSTTNWNNTAPTASVFSVGNTLNVNDVGYTYVAYLFASCPGVSKVGSYTGTGATQVINCGFTGGSRFVLIKATSTTGNWLVWDSARGIVAGNDPYLRLNTTNAEVTNTDWVDTAATGFELSNAAGNLANSNGVSYIFLAIA